MFSWRDLNAHLFVFFIFGFVCVLTVLTIQAHAFVLTGPHILELMTTKMGRPGGIYVKQILTLYPESSDTFPREESIEFQETIVYRLPGEFRSDTLSEQSHKIHVVSFDNALTVIDKKVTSTTQSLPDHYKDILLYRNRPLFQEHLTRLGIDVSVSSLGLYHGTIAHIIGAKYPDESVSQVWVDKDTFRPIRWLLKSKPDETGTVHESIEFRYLKWKRIKRTWYPMRIEFYTNNNLAYKIEVDQIQLDPVVSENFYNIEHLKFLYPPITAGTEDKNDPNDISEVKKTIDDFKKLFE